jgi:hypothetical protein
MCVRRLFCVGLTANKLGGGLTGSTLARFLLDRRYIEIAAYAPRREEGNLIHGFGSHKNPAH